MKITFKSSINKYVIFTGQRHYVDVLDVVHVLDAEDIAYIAEEEDNDWVTIRIVERLEEKENRYYYEDASKLKHILTDKIFTKKAKQSKATLSRRGQAYANRLAWMHSNLELATELGVELQLKNNILANQEKEKLYGNDAVTILGL